MADRWFYAHDVNKIGPFSGRQLHDLAVSGQILPTDTVWKEGIHRGVFASKVQYLFLPTPSLAASVSASVPVSPVPSPCLPAASSPTSVGLTANVQPTAFSEDLQLVPEEKVPITPKPPNAPQPPVRKRRAIVVKGAVIVNQDGVRVQYRKKCMVCSFEESSWSTMPIPNGMTRAGFFCPKCRKRQSVEIQGYPV
jgi:GYF domain 2